jgi:hypothetical protein
MLRERVLDGKFQPVSSEVYLPSLTIIFTVQSRLNDIVELEDECAWCCEEPGVVADILDVCPDDPIPWDGFWSGSTPYLHHGQP